MSVNINLTATAITSSSTSVTGTISVSGAKNNGSEKLNVTVYDTVANAKVTSTDKVYSSTGTVTYAYSNGSSMTVNFSAGTWSYLMPSGTVATNASYVFTFIWSDGLGSNMFSVLSKQNSVSTVYNYTPSYPVVYAAGGTETTATAWPKYIEEIKRIYRLFNENLSYYDSKYASLANGFNYLTDTIYQSLSKMLDSVNASISSLQTYVNSKISEINTAMNTLKADVNKELKGKLNAKCQVLYINNKQIRPNNDSPTDIWYQLLDFSSIGFSKIYFAVAPMRNKSALSYVSSGESTVYDCKLLEYRLSGAAFSDGFFNVNLKLDTTGLYIYVTSNHDKYCYMNGYIIVYGE